MRIKYITILIIAVFFSLVSCERETVEHETVNELSSPYQIEYYISSRENPSTTVRAEINGDDDRDSLLGRFCDYTMEGRFISFRSNKVGKNSSKAPRTFSTNNRSEMIRWMGQMEDEGLTVTVNYDPNTGTWNGIAYTVNPNAGSERRLQRAVMDLDQFGHQVHAVFTYFWDGDKLTDVDMVNGTVNEHYLLSHYTARLTYGDGLRTGIYFYGIDGELVDSYLYSYQDGRLAQEVQNNNTYNYHYNAAGELDYWTITPGYNTLLPNGLRCEWDNGDLVRTYIMDNLLYDSFEYDNHPHPYGISLGTTTLLPGFHAYICQESQWSRHNLTRVVTNSKSEGTDMQISYTYDDEGYPITAETNWYGYCTIHWTFEYYSE